VALWIKSAGPIVIGAETGYQPNGDCRKVVPEGEDDAALF